MVCETKIINNVLEHQTDSYHFDGIIIDFRDNKDIIELTTQMMTKTHKLLRDDTVVMVIHNDYNLDLLNSIIRKATNAMIYTCSSDHNFSNTCDIIRKERKL